MISTGELRKGVVIELDGDLWQILDYHHIKMGRGSAQVRIKLRNVKKGSTVEKSFQAGERWPRAVIDRRPVQFLYRDGDDLHFMEAESYEQFSLRAETLDDAIGFLKEGMTVDRTTYQGETLGIELPVTVDLLVAETEPGYAGDTAQGARKNATMETGLVVPCRCSSTRATRSGSTPAPASTRPASSGRRRMSGTPEPPDWLLPSWDTLPDDPDEPRRAPVPGGTFGLRVRTVSEVSRAIRERVRADDGLRDLWVEGEVGRVTVSTAGHAYFTLKDAACAAPVRVVPRRPGAVAVPAADRAPGRRPRADGRVRAAGRAAAVRRVAPAVGVRQPRDPVRAAQGRARRGGPVRGGAEAAAAPAAADDRRDHLADGRRVARRVHRARAPLADDPRRARRVPGPGRRRRRRRS